MSFLRSYAASPPAPCSTTNVSVAPRTASSQSTTTIRCCSRFWLASSMTPTKAIDTTPASLVNTPTCPSCPSPWSMLLSQISTMASSYAGAKGLMDYTAMLPIIQQPRSSRNYHLVSILLVRLDWGSIQQPPRTSM